MKLVLHFGGVKSDSTWLCELYTVMSSAPSIYPFTGPEIAIFSKLEFNLLTPRCLVSLVSSPALIWSLVNDHPPSADARKRLVHTFSWCKVKSYLGLLPTKVIKNPFGQDHCVIVCPYVKYFYIKLTIVEYGVNLGGVSYVIIDISRRK